MIPLPFATMLCHADPRIFQGRVGERLCLRTCGRQQDVWWLAFLAKGVSSCLCPWISAAALTDSSVLDDILLPFFFSFFHRVFSQCEGHGEEMASG
ncbi:hypothetical protein PITC_073570 [Penicillium italicum]|uniref:Uncharacterized protein n=1 Tax=Penicillium italicum TaxID=40296 RepID=A0A0A2KAD5_PENIT|nr:hypothetical protein PITC_073570 [Penicillium italicum]